MVTWINKLLARESKPEVSPVKIEPVSTPQLSATPIYPPVDQGVMSVSTNDLLLSQVDLIERIKISSGMATAEFEKRFLSTIRNYAAFVHLLPASETEHFRGAGGLLRYGLEVAFHSLQACDGVIFSAKEPLERKRVSESRWRYATFLAALCSEIHVPLNAMVILDASGRQWPSHQVPLTKWLEAEKIDRYWVRWVNPSAVHGSTGKASAAFVLPLILPVDAMDYIKEGGAQIGPALLSVVTGAASPLDQLTMSDVINDMRNKIRDRDLRIQPSLYGRLTVGSHLEPTIIDSMRTLWRVGKWTVNERKSRLWYRDDGLFLVWSAGTFKEISGQFGDINGMPRDEATIIDVLINSNIIETGDGGSPYIEIEASSAKLRCIKFADSNLLWGDSAERPVPIISTKMPAQAAEESSATTQEVSAESNAEASTHDDTASNAPSAVTQAAPQATSQPKTQKVEAQKLKLDAEQFFAQFDKTTATFVRAMVEDIQQKKVNSQSAGTCQAGYAVSLEFLSTFGTDATSLIAKLDAAGWIGRDPNMQKRKIASLTLGGKECMAVILKPEIAKGLGLS